MHLYRFIIEISYDKSNKYQDMPDWWEVCLCITFILSVLGVISIICYNICHNTEACSLLFI